MGFRGESPGGGRGAGSTVGHMAAWAMAYTGALATWPSVAPSGTAALLAGAGFVVGKALLFRGCGCLGRGRRRDADHRLQASVVSLVATLAAMSVLGLARIHGLPAGVALFDGALSLALLALLRWEPRRTRRSARWRGQLDRIALVGTAEALCRALSEGIEALGGRATLLFIDEPTLSPAPGARLRGVLVAEIAELGERLARRELDGVVLVPPLSPGLDEWVRARCREAAIPCAYIGESNPSLPSLRATLAHCPERLLGRAPAQAATSEVAERHIHDALRDRRVCIVGAGDVLGRATAREVLRHQPASLLLVERCPDALVRTTAALPLASCTLSPRLLDTQDAGAVSRCLSEHAPQVVIHAAMPHHVGLAEREPAAVALIHLLGARRFIDAAIESGAECFVYASSTTAVCPIGVLGALTRLVEQYLQARASTSATRLVLVRLPRLLTAGEGTVARFVTALEHGLPLVVSEPERAHCYSTPFDAARDVLEAVAFGRPGEARVPEVGEPVAAVELARRVLACAGLREGVDAPILRTAPHGAERPLDPLAFADEGVSMAVHPSSGKGTWVALAPLGAPELQSIGATIDAVAEAALAGRDGEVVRVLAAALPTFRVSAEHERHWRGERAADAPPPVSLANSQSGAAR